MIHTAKPFNRETKNKSRLTWVSQHQKHASEKQER